MANTEHNITYTTEPPTAILPGSSSLTTLLQYGGSAAAIILCIGVLLYLQGQSLNSLLKTLMSGLRKLDNDKRK